MNTSMNDQTSSRVVIIGSGHAGTALAAALRQNAFPGAIVLVGNEAALPYHRPPLSKAWLKGALADAALLLKPPKFYADQAIDLRVDRHVARIDREARSVVFDDGATLSYSQLVIATGARARTLPLIQEPGASRYGNVLSLRSQRDAGRLKQFLGPGKRIVLIGGGYVGLECAATARQLGTEAVVLEQAPRILQRVASETISRFLTGVHRTHGVEIETGVKVNGLAGAGRIEAVEIDGRAPITCDAVIVGIGAEPNTDLAAGAGLDCDDGVLIDENCRSSDPLIFAIGDIARGYNPTCRRSLRLESVPNTIDQARRAAAAICAKPVPAPELPWFWSDQFDFKLQMAGLPTYQEETVVRGAVEGGSFTVFHLSDRQVVAVESVNAPQDFIAAKKLMAGGAAVEPGRLADPSITLKDLHR